MRVGKETKQGKRARREMNERNGKESGKGRLSKEGNVYRTIRNESVGFEREREREFMQENENEKQRTSKAREREESKSETSLVHTHGKERERTRVGRAALLSGDGLGEVTGEAVWSQERGRVSGGTKRRVELELPGKRRKRKWRYRLTQHQLRS